MNRTPREQTLVCRPVVDVLLHTARSDQPLTSEQIGRKLGTNPAVVRRTLAGLRDAGYVASTEGHGGAG